MLAFSSNYTGASVQFHSSMPIFTYSIAQHRQQQDSSMKTVQKSEYVNFFSQQDLFEM